jgi:homoserine dehydrogenase
MKAYISSEEGTQPYQSHNDILEAVRKSGLEGDVIFVDVTADGERMTEFHRAIIQTTNNSMVTANKKPAASDMATFEAITSNPHRYRYNTTVMAGAGAVPYFQEAHGLSETIESVEGTFSGTLAYVCSELEK